MVIKGMLGLGDNIYMRAALREVKERVYLITSWPELYKDLPHILPVKPKTRLRTQQKNVNLKEENVWHKAPSLPKLNLHYSAGNLKNNSILNTLAKKLGVKPKIFDLPEFSPTEIEGKYAIIRPVTVRSEWCNKARGPLPEYVKRATEKLKEAGYTTVSIADVDGKNEWMEKPIPECDINFNKGELDFEQLMSAIKGASVVVGGVGWIVPGVIAAGVPLITILGGQGGHNAPKTIFSAPMSEEKAAWITPDKYCMCTDMRHACNKKISDFDSQFSKAMEKLCLGNQEIEI